jgi:hypothetical protein
MVKARISRIRKKKKGRKGESLNHFNEFALSCTRRQFLRNVFLFIFFLLVGAKPHGRHEVPRPSRAGGPLPSRPRGVGFSRDGRESGSRALTGFISFDKFSKFFDGKSQKRMGLGLV